LIKVAIMDRLINGDCLEAMKDMPDKSIDLIITSPPYNIGANHHTRGKNTNTYFDNMPEPEYQEWQILILNECHRLLKDNGSMFYNHKNRIKDGVQITPYEWLLKANLLIKQELVWFNGSPNFDKIRFYPMTERIYWLSRSIQTDMHNTIDHHDFFTKSLPPLALKESIKELFR
jgi:modification methylase